MSRIFVVDDEPDILEILTDYLEAHDYEVFSFSSAEDAYAALDDHVPDIMLLDISLPGISGMDLLKRVREILPEVQVIMMTGHPAPDLVVRAMKLGAYEFIPKPLHLERLLLSIQHAEDSVRAQKESLSPIGEMEDLVINQMLGDSTAFRNVKTMIQRIAASSSATILIKGETGTGKEMVARSIHEQSARKPAPFLEINCSALPETLLESELFGHEKGAFTDARERKVGLIERAHGGSFFLDEIGDMELNLQAKILKLLEQKSLRRVGGTSNIQVDVRFIAATHKDLDQMILDGQFREDLYYRLNVITLDIPPLRERGNDILMLADFFIAQFNRSYRKEVQGLSADAREYLLHYSWPGNVRELRNALERAVLIESRSWIEIDHLYLQRRKPVTRPTDSRRIGYDFDVPEEGFSLDEFEKILISRTLVKNRYNVSRTARQLGLTRETLRYRIKKHNIH